MNSTASKSTLVDRITHEVVRYAAVCIYLYICFGALLLYKTAVLRSEGVEFAPYGFALIKALILGKFMLIGHALKVGERSSDRPLIYPILHRSLVFLVLLLVLDLVEEVVAGWLHGRAFTATLLAITGDSLLQILATCLIVFLILLPYFAYLEIGRWLGESTLIRIMFVEKKPRSDL